MDEVLTLEMLEEEFIKENTFSFAKTQEKLNFLLESIEMDFKLLDSNLLNESNDDGDKADKLDKKRIGQAIKNKIVSFLETIGLALSKLILKIRAFIKEKFEKFKQDHIIKKIDKNKIDEDKLIEKLNKHVIFDPNSMLVAWKDNFIDAALESYKDLKNGSGYSFDESYIKLIDVLKYIFPSDLKKIDDKTGNNKMARVEFHKGRLIDELSKVLTDTGSALNEITKTQEEVKGEVNKANRLVQKAESEEELKNAKKLVKLSEMIYKAACRVTSYFTKQVTFLTSLMTSLAKNTNASNEEKAPEAE